uniref:Hflx-type G domain-containing protein n=1 Tax=Kalanchoe fedtschenkoi TaxID=63787 RepID=A0A7N0UJ77_KALFE
MYRRALVSIGTHLKFQSSARIYQTQKPNFDCTTSHAHYAQSVAIHASQYLAKKESRKADEPYFEDPNEPLKLFVVQPRLRPDKYLQAKLSEALNLANSLEEQRDWLFDGELNEKAPPDYVVVQNPIQRRSTTGTFFGKGTVDAIKIHLNALEEKGEIDAVFVNAVLAAIQQRNLERVWKKPVLDRVGLIIEIFNAHAQTREAKLQAELAALNYKKTRLIRTRGPGGRYTFGESGEAEVVSARGRGSGGRGFISGAGETELQLQRRRINERRNRLLAQIEDVRRTRALQRASRKRHGGSHGQELPTVAIVGYTNAGKSTLVSALSKTDLYSDDRLFATVDPRLRAVVLPSGRKALLSDTVGFISDLPVQLIDAFHATLEEVVYADLLVHVLDSSAPNLDEHRSAVLQVLQQIGVPEEKTRNMIEVWNKIDIQDEGMDIRINEYIDGDGDGDDYIDDAEADSEMEGEDSSVSSDGLQDEGEDADDQPFEEEMNAYNDDGEDNLGEPLMRIEEAMDEQIGDIPGEDNVEELLSAEEDAMHALMGADSQEWIRQSGETEDDGDSDATSLKSDDDPGTTLSNEWDANAGGPHPRPETTPHVKTSAVTRVGLLELLELIDEKLRTMSDAGKQSSSHFEEGAAASASSR